MLTPYVQSILTRLVKAHVRMHHRVGNGVQHMLQIMSIPWMELMRINLVNCQANVLLAVNRALHLQQHKVIHLVTVVNIRQFLKIRVMCVPLANNHLQGLLIVLSVLCPRAHARADSICFILLASHVLLEATRLHQAHKHAHPVL